MVVVAIIGILAAIAIPNYQKYQARARQTEAKVALSSIYTAEQGFAVENSTYSDCIKRLGVNLDIPKRYYVVGMKASSSANTCGPAGGVSCLTYAYSGTAAASGATCADAAGETRFAETAKVVSGWTLATDLSGGDIPAIDNGADKEVFTYHAAGNITNELISDVWVIDNNKNLYNSKAGI